ncbi:DegV family protein [Sharpea azabuensis]|uniref:DegV family protein n=1 Tax=Sharpea azabuensis TaxID=322505 RepID=UPI00240969D4|nr:DegV family protein [Sharpea azabuensis]MDD6512736.1 DegV family protein [Sharpea azabuensis]
MSKIAIFTDSGCQIEIKGDHPGIYVAPLCITMHDRAYLDQYEINSIDVFKEMARVDQIVMTSQPPLGSMIEVLTEIKKDGYDEVIGVSIATGLSSTMTSMQIAADNVDIPITLVDSHATARIQKELVLTARKLADLGKNSAEIKAILDEMVKDSRTIIMVPNLEHLKKGGRITPAVALLAGLLKVVPVMELNHELGGKIDTLGKVRTVKKAIKTLADRMIELGVNSKDYVFAIEHVLAEDSANSLKAYLEEKIGPADILVRELPAVVGAHMGVGGVGVQFIKKCPFA